MRSPDDPKLRALRHPGAHHLRRASDIQRVYREGNRARGTWMTVVARANDVGFTRLCLSVGRAAWRKAVKRNRVRRIFREAFRLEQGALPEGADLILIAARGVSPDLASARTEIVHLANKAWRRYLDTVAKEARSEPSDRAPGVREGAPEA